MLTAEEEDKRSISLELHEGVAQTLCSIKVRLEDRLQNLERDSSDGDGVRQIMPVLQGAIEDVRALAGSLRPSSLDELGLLPTIQWFCGSFERLHPNVVIERDVDVAEDDTPLGLKIVIYRIIESALPIIAHHRGPIQVRLDLRRAGESIRLEIENTPRDSRYQAASLARDFGQLRFAKIKERITLSGGAFTLLENALGGLALHGSWPLLPLETTGGETRQLQRAAERVGSVP
jgi:signal transduction histidine kinase